MSIKNSIGTRLGRISKSLHLLSPDYEKIIFLGGFNVTDEENNMESFCENYGLRNLITQTTFLQMYFATFKVFA